MEDIVLGNLVKWPCNLPWRAALVQGILSRLSISLARKVGVGLSRTQVLKNSGITMLCSVRQPETPVLRIFSDYASAAMVYTENSTCKGLKASVWGWGAGQWPWGLVLAGWSGAGIVLVQKDKLEDCLHTHSLNDLMCSGRHHPWRLGTQ